MKVYFSSAKYFLFLLNSLFEFNVRKTGIYLLLICISTSLKAQDISLLIKEADRLEAIPNEKQALAQFKEVLKVQPLNLYALTKCSELSSRVGAREKKSETRDTYNQSAIMFAKTAFKYYPGKDEACVAMGIAIGRSILNKSGKEKIAAVYDIKKYADKAIAINPKNFKAWHILGKWNYEISNLNLFEKTAIRIFYGGLPESSFRKSIDDYEKAKLLNPNFCLNYLELAKAYEKNNQINKGLIALKYILTMPIRTEDDPRIKTEAAQLIQKWK